ncbi:MAG: hypothetical protein EWV58_16545 [Microcystis aeruginosa Ma_MB_F_20061100_S19]|uniref:Plasmid stabilization system protein n=1 Tax=Microcystis aeruginosa SPC777 TaxID=482300 RepID=S3J6J7_MICAE|nr:hypothetical protein [Microcystis aeruginosa]NCR99489.1 hypothetical protein [Microcystis aeruginosa L311-01]OCY12702.1 MAG: hypothetical protein BEV12_08630 [Microcystis aeruginosa CACIAM 03]TRU12305.1 MAG: hypothetical protein EWV59_08820 [Microcystis aeruginosa Ma_MB_F_20061100_S19D]TRU12453.1 MAG: hypothetical protein EWV58_16545 [Microcystis aeruginosa Ma_MB_F_20061100_S19]EPF21473.1 hypothetical protein MAESPC_02639 [Microcystis aeruginosa SPC777]
MKLVADKSFKRAFQSLISKNPQLQSKVSEVLHLLADNPFTPSLKSHNRLSGVFYSETIGTSTIAILTHYLLNIFS